MLQQALQGSRPREGGSEKPLVGARGCAAHLTNFENSVFVHLIMKKEGDGVSGVGLPLRRTCGLAVVL